MSTHVQLVFLMDGFNAAYRELKDREVDTGERLYGQHANTHNGYIGIVSNMAAYAYAIGDALDEYILANYFDIVEYPGVFEYEVTEELGAWLFTRPEAFTEGRISPQFRSQVKAKIEAWFNPVPKGTQPEKAP